MLEDLDRHVLFFPPEGLPVWRVVKSEGRLTDEHLARLGGDVNRRDDRAAKSPAPLVRPPVSLGKLVSDRVARLERKRLQTSMWPEPDVDVDGRKRKG